MTTVFLNGGAAASAVWTNFLALRPWPDLAGAWRFRRHSLTMIEAAALLRGPRPMLAPRLKVGIGASCQECLPRVVSATGKEPVSANLIILWGAMEGHRHERSCRDRDSDCCCRRGRAD